MVQLCCACELDFVQQPVWNRDDDGGNDWMSDATRSVVRRIAKLGRDRETEGSNVGCGRGPDPVWLHDESGEDMSRTEHTAKQQRLEEPYESENRRPGGSKFECQNGTTASQVTRMQVAHFVEF